ncbi:hypothetical protein ALT721_590014 [Alteromonas alvinellae]
MPLNFPLNAANLPVPPYKVTLSKNSSHTTCREMSALRAFLFTLTLIFINSNKQGISVAW